MGVARYSRKYTGCGAIYAMYTVVSLMLSALKPKILDEIEQSNGIKHFLKIFCKFVPNKGSFCWKVSLKTIYTIYLKH